VRQAIVIGLAVIGCAFSLSGAVGILRMPDVYSRIQCSSKTITMGALPVLIALVVGEGVVSSYAGRALLVAVLLLVLNPAASHALARAAYKAGVPMWPGAVTDQADQGALRRLAARRQHDAGQPDADPGRPGEGPGQGDGQEGQ
jgi:multicomponent Na+:H+ antiporter subunit G